MKRKKVSLPVEAQRRAVPQIGKAPRKPGRCYVCGSEVAPFADEDLCWVCRRLKISAWRESDNQAAAQE